MKRTKNGQGHKLVGVLDGRYKKPRFLKGRGVTEQSVTDGHGNTGVFWTASIQAYGETRITKFSVARLGNTGARRAARELRTKWEKEFSKL